MLEKPTEKELASRIRKAIEANPSELTFALWEGYIGALLEWGLIEPSCHSRLCELIPQSTQLQRASLGMFLGEDGAESYLQGKSDS